MKQRTFVGRALTPGALSRRERGTGGGPWESLRPVWQLRVGHWRVFYDVDEDVKSVIVRAVRKKGRKLTEETL